MGRLVYEVLWRGGGSLGEGEGVGVKGTVRVCKLDRAATSRGGGRSQLSWRGQAKGDGDGDVKGLAIETATAMAVAVAMAMAVAAAAAAAAVAAAAVAVAVAGRAPACALCKRYPAAAA